MSLTIIALIFIGVILAIEIPVFISERREEDMFVIGGMILALGILIAAKLLEG